MALKRVAKRISLPKLFQPSIHPSWIDIKKDSKPKVVILGCGWGGFRVGTFRPSPSSFHQRIARIIYSALYLFINSSRFESRLLQVNPYIAHSAHYSLHFLLISSVSLVCDVRLCS